MRRGITIYNMEEVQTAEYKTLTALQQILTNEDDYETQQHAVETALTIIKDRKLHLEEKAFNDPNYYKQPDV
jgi:hypothetical protein